MDDVTQQLSDERLIAATLTGNDEAFARLVARHKGRIFRLASRFARDNDDLEDICQEVFIKAYENLGKFRGQEAPFEHWVTKIAVHAGYDALRRNRHGKRHQTLDDMPFELKDDAEAARSDARQARQLLHQAMTFLSPDERLVITLMELEEMTLRETSQLTGWSEANVKVRAFRARQALRKILEKHDAK
ncbi:RNA polymerase sigma factor [Pelotalea chapellei]|uniref:Sigma-70 family RNA polymerase sigma factor n=1 Tax=Pelotalea chapellei TaxID=44671 RepID=A0ABS5UCU3_9BACT|nr:sigma-70 family RNA polymerase sigma factor [Pelotalea chapellei]MBT1073464.1 sigma-70 family RNA polymerase sigma factor [Pelotalea chapellei]